MVSGELRYTAKHYHVRQHRTLLELTMSVMKVGQFCGHSCFKTYIIINEKA